MEDISNSMEISLGKLLRAAWKLKSINNIDDLQKILRTLEDIHNVEVDMKQFISSKLNSYNDCNQLPTTSSNAVVSVAAYTPTNGPTELEIATDTLITSPTLANSSTPVASKRSRPKPHTTNIIHLSAPEPKQKLEAESYFGPNTNPDVHVNNSKFNRVCLHCNKFAPALVKHYTKEHPDNEVPISRPSPLMARQLRLRSARFEVNGVLMRGNCFFCGKTKKCEKQGWQFHYLSHTGEKMFICDCCQSETDTKCKHSSESPGCPGHVSNIFKNNHKSSIVGFICNDCNYIQIASAKIIKHLTKEHGYIRPVKNHHYEEVTLFSC